MGGKSAPAPDYTPLASASEESARIMGAIAREQLGFARGQYADLAPLARNIAAQQQTAQAQQMKQAQDYYNYMQQTYRPLEQGLVRQAQEFDTEAAREQLARKAAADAGRAFGTTQAAQQRSMASMGINPASGRFQSMGIQSDLGLAAQKASAMTGARERAQQLGYARKLDVAGLGRGLPGASTAAYGGATAAGTAANQSYMAPGNQFMTGMAQGAQTMGTGLGQQITGLSNVLNTQANVYNQAMNARGEMFGSILGAGGNIAAAALSDRRVKKNIQQIGIHNQTGLPLYEFEYIFLPGAKYIGVMADDVEKRYPDAVMETESGIKAVNYEMLGIEMVEV